MFDGLRRAIGAISVREERGKIMVGGIPADTMAKDIARIWSTSRVNSHMFTHLGRSGFSFYSFYAIEVLFIIDELIKHPKAYTNVRALKRLREELVAETWLSSIDEEAMLDFDYKRLNEIVYTPKPYQQEFLEVYQAKVAQYKLRGYLLAAEPGTGKTLNSIMLALVSNADCTVIVSPKRAVHDPWEATLSTAFKQPVRWWSTGLNKPIDDDANWLVFHYEALDQAVAWASRQKKFKRVNIILDECHNLNDPNSQRTQAFMAMCEYDWIQSVLWMSGTPIKAIGNEAIPFLTTIDPRFNDKVRDSFVKIFGKQASRAVEILSNRIGLTSFKVAKQSVMTLEVVETTKKVAFKGSEQFTLAKIKEEIRVFVEERWEYYKLHEKKFHDIYWALLAKYERTIRDRAEAEDYRVYVERVKHLNKRFDPVSDKDIVVWCNRFEEQYICPKLSFPDRKEFRHVRSIFKYVALKIRGEALGRILTKRRIECFKAMVPHCELPALIDATEKKTLIFTSYVDVVRVTDEYLRKEGYKPLLVYADTNKNLPMIMKQFKEDPDLNPMIATFDSLSTAVPVIEANHCVLLNPPFRDHEYKQATSRVNRLGQDSIVRITNMLLDTGVEPNISTRSNEIMEWSRASVNAIMGLDGVDETVSVEDMVVEVTDIKDPYTKVLMGLVSEELYTPSFVVPSARTALSSTSPVSKENFFFGDF